MMQKAIIFNFRKNDLDPSKGKQIEFNSAKVEEFFSFSSPEVNLTLRYVQGGSPINGKTVKTYLKLSPERGDYKIYQNADGSPDLKDFFRNSLGLNEENINDYFALKKVDENNYDFFYFPQTTTIDVVYKALKLDKSQVICDIENSSKNDSFVAITNRTFEEPRQLIYFGAPGTGKSHEIKKQTAGQSVVRTTFHPDSDYSTFVGAYKPTTKEIPVTTVIGTKAVPVEDSQGNPVIESKIVYEFVEQAFLKAYVNAWTLLAENKPQFLIVEEINRGNCAQIFGDLFQLLDRNDFGFSDYPIIADSDLKKFLSKAFKNLNIDDGLIQGEYEKSEDGKSIAERVKSGEVLLLPKNLYIWATMNTSDQSLFPIDSAFKRRWDWKYIPIDTKKENWSIKVNGSAYSWSDFLEKVNEKIGSTTSSEDKKLGFYFCKANNTEISADRFVSKVLFYIYNDVFKDYGYEDPMFKNDGKVMPFQSFYNTDGSVNETVVDILLKNLNVLKNSEVIAGDDEESEDSDSSGKDLTRYTINGEGSFPKRQVATEAIKKYIELNPGKTAAEVVADWKTLGNVVSHFVETQEEYDGRQDNSKRSNEVACGSEKFYVSHNGWEPNSIQRLMNAVNAKDWGITLAKAE